MSSKMPQFLKNMNLYVDGKGYAGRVEEITLPKLTIKTEEFRGGGMDAPVEIDMGMEKLECSFTLNEYDNGLFALWGLVPGSQVNITMRGAFDQDGTIVPVVVTLTGSWKEIDMGNWKPGEKAALKVSVAARKYGLVIDGIPIVLIDVPGMKRVVAGKDMLSDVRAAIGL